MTAIGVNTNVGFENIVCLQAAKKGVSDTTSGFIFGVFALVQFITSPIFGKLVRRLLVIHYKTMLIFTFLLLYTPAYNLILLWNKV